MELFNYLKEDHDTIRRFTKEFELAENLKVKDKIFKEMLVFLRAYFRAIEQALYSKCLKTNMREMSEMTLDGYEEHHLIEDLVYRIKNSKKDDELWLSRIKDFFQILDLHLILEAADYYSELKSYLTLPETERVAISYLKARKLWFSFYENEQLEKLEPSLNLGYEVILN